MTTIYLIRHGEAEGNIYNRAQGQFNSNLTPFGHRQLEKLANRFLDIDVDKVYASDLKRAFLTGKCIADMKNLEVIKSEKLREINLGIIEDLPWADFPKLYPEMAFEWKNSPKTCKIPQGESPLEVGQRIFDEITAISCENDEKNIVIASHGAGIRYFLYKILGFDINDLKAIEWCDNTSVAKILYENGKFDVQYQGDNSHLEGLENPFHSKKWYEMSEEELALGVNLHFKPLDLENEFSTACGYIREFNSIAYDTNDFFDEQEYFEKCKRTLEIDEKSMCFVMLQHKIIGFISADLEKSSENIGYIGNIILSEKYRGLGLTPQLIGELSSIYRKKGKDTLVAKVSEKNARALAFYKKIGFLECEKVTENGFIHIIMKLDLTI